jgi:hypothetical protein
MPIFPGAHDVDLSNLHRLSQQSLVSNMLPKISIRWRGIVGLIATSNYKELEKLLFGRTLVLENKSITKKLRGTFISNWVRLTSTLRLPKNF